MHTITNDLLSVTIAGKGAELQRIYHKQHKQEYMWEALPAWPKKSPVLFPIVGGLKNNTYYHNGKQYQMSRHGFARDMEFTVIDQSETSITYNIQSNERTLLIYPFPFSFSIAYTLKDRALEVCYLVENTGNETMYFSVGGHPAFKVPLVPGSDFEDYYLYFHKTITADRWPLTDSGLIKSKPVELIVNDDSLPLTRKLFSTDALVFKHPPVNEVTLQSPNTDRRISVVFDGFPYLGIWQAQNGDFVCIEPWCGIADSEASSGELQNKEGINALAPGNIFKAAYTIIPD